MFDRLGKRYSLRENVTHFLFCNNPLFPGCTGHVPTLHDGCAAEERDRLLNKAREWRARGMFTDSEWGAIMGVLWIDTIVPAA